MIMADDKPRRLTAAEIEAQSNGTASGECPRCGCKDWRGEDGSWVELTRHPKGRGTVRKRICRHCGQVGFVTEEIVIPEGYRAAIVPDSE